MKAFLNTKKIEVANERLRKICNRSQQKIQSLEEYDDRAQFLNTYGKYWVKKQAEFDKFRRKVFVLIYLNDDQNNSLIRFLFGIYHHNTSMLHIFTSMPQKFAELVHLIFGPSEQHPSPPQSIEELEAFKDQLNTCIKVYTKQLAIKIRDHQCDACDKQFGSSNALEQHQLAKSHGYYHIRATIY